MDTRGIGIIGAALVVLIMVASAWQQVIKIEALKKERDALRAEVRALTEGDGSCAVTRDGPKVLCWMEHGSVKQIVLPSGAQVKLRRGK